MPLVILRIMSLVRGLNVKSILDKSVMKVKELIAELQKQDAEKDVIMFDGPSYYTPLGRQSAISEREIPQSDTLQVERVVPFP